MKCVDLASADHQLQACAEVSLTRRVPTLAG
ncbi:hypothetical protein EPYR_01320 [Erwinia pyrifoliae DSM 12163]|nr:hypothetical protein EPYR_01320 [Erwinia pyrifoliae DSM 12163]